MCSSASRCVSSDAFRERRAVVQEIRFVLPAARVLEAPLELAPGCSNSRVCVSTRFRWPVFSSSFQNQNRYRCCDAPSMNGTCATSRWCSKSNSDENVQRAVVVDLAVEAAADDDLLLLAVLRHLRERRAAVVVIARRELVVRQVVLIKDVGLEKEAAAIGVVDQIDARVDLRVRREAAQVRRQIGLALVERADAERETRIELQAFGLILAIDDVDDAGHAGCVVRRGRVVDDLDALDAAGRDAVEPGLIADAREAGLLAVDENRDAIAAAQLDLPLLTDRDAG